MRFIAAFFVLTASVAAPSAQDWTQWRGPSRDGTAPSFTAPAAWPERPKQVWKVQAGVGHSSPVSADDRVYLHSRVGEQEAVTAYALADGKQIWRQTYDAPYQMNPAATAHGKGPKSTPVYDRNRLYTLGISGVLTAWNAVDGRRLWTKNFKGDYPATSPDFGVAMSPVVTGGVVIVHVGGNGNGAVLALDSGTGAVKWSWKGDGPAYASPVVAPFGGTRHVITQTQRSVVGLSMADGSLLWQLPFSTAYEQNSITPVVIGDLVVYGGLSKPTTAVRIKREASTWKAEQVWQNADTPMYMSSPVVSDGVLFGLTHRNSGQFFGLDARSGKTLWTTRGREGENAALIVAGDYLMAVTTEGELVVARKSAKSFDLVKRYTVAESPIWAHPAPVGRGLVIKDAETLAYWTF
ncbi:MAG: PQQ-like beta-propeller repeat protein [Acidobacteria bacterium]|nr:PQQ-like beta-propeller repeat protein [Acidobacteriota bacterium]